MDRAEAVRPSREGERRIVLPESKSMAKRQGRFPRNLGAPVNSVHRNRVGGPGDQPSWLRGVALHARQSEAVGAGRYGPPKATKGGGKADRKS